MSKKWWEKEPLRIVEICDASNFNALSLEEEAEMVKRLGGNVQHFHCMLSHGADLQDTAGINEDRFFFETSLAKKKNPDRLKTYLPLAHKRGIKVIVYFNVHWYTREFGKMHPDWQQIKEDGKPMDDVYTTGTSFCINSHYREWVFHVLRDLGKYDIDGIHYDGPIFFASTCYCEVCRRLFKERTGKELPPKSNRQHPDWKQLRDFQSDSLARFLADSDSVIKEINREILLYMNGNANWPYWPTGRDNHKIVKNTDMLIAEGGFVYNDLNQTAIYKPGITAKLLSSQSLGKPVFSANCAGHKPWNFYVLPKAEIGLMFAETLSGGAGFWTAVFVDDLSQPALEAITTYNDFIKKNPAPFFKTKSLARVALVWPSRSVEVYAGSSIPLTDFTKQIKAEGIGDIGKEFEGFYEGLARAQVPFDVIDEENFDKLSRYELLFLPNASCFSQKSVYAIMRFVKGGGNLVASFETSLYNETGQKAENFQLSELFGVRFSGSIFGPMDWDYFSPSSDSNSSLLEDITKKYIPASLYGISVEPTASQALFYFCERLAGSYEHIPMVSNRPFLTMNRVGKGNVLYLAGTFGLSLANFRFPEYLSLIRNICLRYATPWGCIENAPWVEVNLRQKKGKIFLHLINQTSGLKRPLTYLHPLTDLKIDLFGMRVKKALALWAGKRLSLKKSRKGVSFILPYLKDYEVIELI